MLAMSLDRVVTSNQRNRIEMFDATLQAISIEVVPQEDHVQLAIVVGIVLPVAPGTGMPVPIGVLRVPMSKATLLARGQELLDAAEAFPEPQQPSGLVVANSLAGVDQAVKQAEAFKGPTR